jgi:hypothetical protein
MFDNQPHDYDRNHEEFILLLVISKASNLIIIGLPTLLVL